MTPSHIQRADPFDLFAADHLCLEAGMFFVRAVTAGEHGRYEEQAELVAKGRAALGKALIRTSEQPIAARAAQQERAVA